MFWDFYYSNDISQLDLVDTTVVLQSIRYLVLFGILNYAACIGNNVQNKNSEIVQLRIELNLSISALPESLHQIGLIRNGCSQVNYTSKLHNYTKLSNWFQLFPPPTKKIHYLCSCDLQVSDNRIVWQACSPKSHVPWLPVESRKLQQRGQQQALRQCNNNFGLDLWHF